MVLFCKRRRKPAKDRKMLHSNFCFNTIQSEKFKKNLGNILNKISPKKLLKSKWTAMEPLNKEKHFLIVDVDYDEDGAVISCLIEAIMSKRTIQIYWRDLKDTELWVQGWK